MNGAPPILLILGFFACFGFVFLLIAAQFVRMIYLAKNGGLALAPKFCPHCGHETPAGGGVWYPTSPGALFRASSLGVGPLRIGGPFTKAGWTCVKCGGTMDKGATR